MKMLTCMAALLAVLSSTNAMAQAAPADRQERLKEGMRQTFDCARDYASKYIATPALPQDVADATWAKCGGPIAELSLVARQTLGDDNAATWATKTRTLTRDTAILIVLEGRYPPRQPR